ncbi:MAG: T9SS type A sorting domain-containing protein [Bacteroidales bacterium]|jgi:hypothetical protein|nr:T9SS type A sorting domain-containing protein [Bacteroidales bacterium]
MKFILVFSLIVFVFSGQLYAQVPPERIVNWSNAGLSYPINEDIESVSILDFGGMPDDAISDDDALENAINCFAGAPGKIQFPAGTFHFNARIVLPSGIILEGTSSEITILHANLESETDFIYASGSVTGDNMTVINAQKGNDFLVLQTLPTDLQAGDVVKVQMDGEPYMFSDWAYSTMAQLCEVDSLVADTVFLKSNLRHDYPLENNPVLVKITPVRDILIKNMQIVRADASTAQTCNIRFNYAYNCSVRGIQSENCNFSHLSLRTSLHCEVSGCYFHHAHAYGEGGQGYGAEVSASSSDCLIHNNVFEHLRHSMLLQSGANGNVFAYNYSFDPYWDQSALPSASAGDLVLHGNYVYCNLFEGNIAQNAVIDDSHGSNGPYNTFFRNRLEKYGIVMNFNPATDSCNFIGNEITNLGFLLGNYMLNGNGHFEYGNNKTGDCIPAETENILEESLYLENSPCYFYDQYTWSSIGYPAGMNENNIPAYDRYFNGVMTFDTCENAVLIDGHQVMDGDMFQVFPNPNSGSFRFLGNEQLHIRIFTIDGSLVLDRKVAGDEALHTNLKSGMYLIQIDLGSTSEYKKMIIKN